MVSKIDSKIVFKIGNKVILKKTSVFYKQQGKAKYGTIKKISRNSSLPFVVKWEKGHNNGRSATLSLSYGEEDLKLFNNSLKTWLKNHG